MRLDLVVGSNGAGKTTFIRKTLLPSLPPGTHFVNADEIAKARWPEDPEANSYAAAKIAAQTRSALIAARQPFVAETVFSHPSKLELITDARAGDFHVSLHVVLVPEELTVRRVVHRVASGGHSVPEDKIRGRYQRLWAVVVEAMKVCDSAVVYDNSSRAAPRPVAQLICGVPIGRVDWPAWAPSELTEAWSSN